MALTYYLNRPDGTKQAINAETASAYTKNGLAKGYSLSYENSATPTQSTSSAPNLSTPLTGPVNLTPAQVAQVQSQNPQMAQQLGLPASGGTTLQGTPTSTGPLPSLVQAKPETRTLPTATPTASTTTQSLPTAPKSSLVEFSNALSQATALARQSRQATQLGILDTAGFKPGTVNPSTMAGILKLLDARSSNYSDELTGSAQQAYRDNQAQQQNQYEQSQKQQFEQKAQLQELALQMLTQGASQESIQGVLAAPDLDSGIAMAAGVLKAGTKDGDIKQLGAKLVKVDGDGNVQLLFDGSSAGSGGGGGSSSGVGGTSGGKHVTSGGLSTTTGDIGALSTALNGARGADGYTDPNLYMDNYDQWVQQGGLPNDFIKYFPPKQYLNPAVDPKVLGRVVPEFIISALGGSKASSSGGGIDFNDL